jgi:hypothetical protein
MYFDSNEVNTLLNCKKCENRLDEPSLLACGNSICSYCLKSIILDINKRKFDCIICDDLHEMPLLGLPTNNLAKQMLSIKGIDISRGENFNILHENLKKIQKKTNNLKYNLTNPNDYLKEHFIELRNKLQLTCEDKCMKLNDKCQEMIYEIDKYAINLKVIKLDSFRYSFKIMTELEEFNLQADKYLNLNDINEEKLIELNERALLLMKKSDDEIEHLKRILLNGRYHKFIENFEQIKTDNLGFFSDLNSDFRPSLIANLAIDDFNKLFDLSEINFDNGDWRLIYRASRDGFLASDFHSKCDDKPNTFIIIRTSKYCIFGGYTEKSWSSDDDFDELKPDPESFIFSYINSKKRKLKINCSANKGIVCNKKNGPKFGEDLVIEQNAKGNDNYSNLGKSYIHPDFEFDSPKARQFLADEYFFMVTEMEVFTRF